MADTSFIPLSSLHDRASDWFGRAHAALLGAVPCRRGCSRCCIGPFAITVLDAGMLRRGLDGLSAETRDDIEARARSQIAAAARVFPRLARSPFLDDWSDDEQDALATAFAELPCPALDVDGCCRVYDARPVTCRTMGIPIEAGGTVEGACEIQTAVPVVRLPAVFREQEEGLAEQEARELQNTNRDGEEILIAYGFLPERAWTGF
jgi:Fe-S-cluster containining protein